MNDCERMIIDELAEVKKDVKSLLLDVNSLKVRSAMWGILGGAIFSVLMMLAPMVIKSFTVSPVHSQVVRMDTTHVTVP
jgi:hypothetical protein